jgi:16S rRNA U516 pseudouridylate synthase RsuA-like enzyme
MDFARSLTWATTSRSTANLFEPRRRLRLCCTNRPDLSTRKDQHARNTIFDLLPQKFSRLFNIGRLDAQTEGLFS